MENNVTPIRSRQAFQSPKNPAFLQNRIDRYYRERVMNTWDGGNIMRGLIPSHGSLVLTSNDYLSIAQHPAIKRAIANTVEQQGNGALMSGVFLHGPCPQLELEDRLGKYMHAETGILCQSGWCANTGLIQSIANEHTPVYIDMFAHASLWEGIKSASAKAVPVFHNDVEHLERQVLKYGPGIIIVDAIYSTSGSISPLREIAKIAEKEGCIFVVDESHSLGTHGPDGAGLVAELGLSDKVHFRTASLAKAFAARAGIICCSQDFNEYFKFEANPAIFSSTLLPYEVAGLAETLNIIQQEHWRRVSLHQNAEVIRHALEELGYNLNDSASQIISLEPGPEKQTIVLRDALEAHGVFGSVFCASATPKNRSLIRFSINAEMSEPEINHLIKTCEKIRDRVDMHNWPSTKRKGRTAALHSPTTNNRNTAETSAIPVASNY